MGSGAEVRNIGAVDVNITGSEYYIGGLLGSNDNAAVTMCYSTGSVNDGTEYSELDNVTITAISPD